MAAYNPNDPNRDFFIALKDRRLTGNRRPWSVRWWAVPKTLDQPDVTVPPGEFLPREFLLARLFMSPGITVRELASDLRVEPSVIQPELDRLREAGQIRVEGERLFLAQG
jgi:DNA-binding transcriptional ArsR family regulator